MFFLFHDSDMIFSCFFFFLESQEMGHTSSTDKRDAGSVNLEDYDPIDPVPSSKTSISSGPIQHGTPLMPFIPKPSPPDHPKHSGFP